MSQIYHYSQIHGFLKNIYLSAKVYFRESFLGRLSGIKKEFNLLILKDSKLISWILLSYKVCKNRLIAYFKNSGLATLIEKVKKNLCFRPLNIFSFVIVISILANILLSLLLNQKINSFGWIIRLLFLFIGTFNLNSSIDWPTIKSNSLFLRLLSR